MRFVRIAVLLGGALVGCRSGFDTIEDAHASPPDDARLTESELAEDAMLDLFDTISYSNNNGEHAWSTPWVEVGDDDLPADAFGANIFIESHAQNPTPNALALKIRVADGAGHYIYREANLAGATSATLFYQFHNELQTTGIVDVQVSPDGSAWTTVQSYAAADVFGSESIPITAFATATTRIRVIAGAVGGRHFRIDDLGIEVDR